MKNERIAIFDMDGTLVDTDDANTAAYRIALNSVGIRNIAGIYGRMTANSICSITNMALSAEIDEVVRLKVEAYCAQLWRTRLGPAAEAFRCVIIGRDMFDKVVLLTNSAERRVIETLRHYGLVRCFDEIVCNGGKDNKYINYFNMFDSDPAASVVWENEEGQINSAIAAGVKVENTRKVG